MPSAMLVNKSREKVINAIVFFASKTNNCGKLKLFKLLFLLDFEHFRRTGRSVTGLTYSAWKFGPVPIEVYQEWDAPESDFQSAISIVCERIFDFSVEMAIPRVRFNEASFTRRELSIMHDIASAYETATAREMVDVTHAENGVWDKVWNNGKGINEPIPYELSVALDEPYREAILEAAREYSQISASRRVH